jgi:peptide deformylase
LAGVDLQRYTAGDMLLKIVEVGDPVLREAARALSPEEVRGAQVAALIELMRETMRDAPGVGLAAPQIGESLQLAVIEDRAEYQRSADAEDLAARDRAPVPFHVIINPRLQILDPGPATFAEGCLSVPGFMAQVERATSVRVDALDHHGQPVTIQASGWYARILQHEIDHLLGTLYVDRMDTRTFSSMREHARGASLARGPRVLR